MMKDLVLNRKRTSGRRAGGFLRTVESGDEETSVRDAGVKGKWVNMANT